MGPWKKGYHKNKELFLGSITLHVDTLIPISHKRYLTIKRYSAAVDLLISYSFLSGYCISFLHYNAINRSLLFPFVVHLIFFQQTIFPKQMNGCMNFASITANKTMSFLSMRLNDSHNNILSLNLIVNYRIMTIRFHG